MILEIILGVLYTIGWIWCFKEWLYEYHISHKTNKLLEVAVFAVFMVIWLPLVIFLMVAIIIDCWLKVYRKWKRRCR